MMRRVRVFGRLGAVGLILSVVLTACGSESHVNAPTSQRLDVAHALPATFAAHSSVEQVYVTDAAPGNVLELATADGTVLMSGTADAEGTLIFRDLTPGTGYVVASDGDGHLRAARGVRVMDRNDPPPASFYAEQQIGGGYGYLKTRDGTLLAINVILPGPVENGPYPTVVEYSGYDPANPDSPQPSTLIAGAFGYAAVGVNMRGSGCSGGAFNFFETPQSTDGYDVIEAIAAQPWVKNHKVGMVGISYPGISQLFVAQLEPPHLAAIAPLSIISDTFRGTLYPGGILNNGFAVQFAMDRQHDAQPFGQPWSQKRRDEGDQVCIDNQKLRGQTPDLLALIQDNKFFTTQVAAPLAPSTFVQRINVPVFLAGAWQDEQTGGYFSTMLDQFTGSDKLHFTLVNGGHTDSIGPSIFGRWLEFLSFYVKEEIPQESNAATIAYQTIGPAIFGIQRLRIEPDRFTDAPSFEAALARFEAEPKVRILFENGAGGAAGSPISRFERSYNHWPVEDLVPSIWYFRDGGQLDPAQPTADGADEYVYDTSASQRTTFHGNDNDVWLALPAWDWQPPAAGTAVAYASDPLTETLVMAGSGSVDLWVKSTATDTDLQVTLSEIRPDGKETYVQNGWLRASHRKLDPAASTVLRPVQTHLQSDAAPLPPGQFVQARVELFPFAHVFRAGSRIRISVETPGGSRPRWRFDVLSNDGQVINSIGRSAAAPSRIVLPVLPGVEVTSALPACPSLRGQPCRPYQEIANTPAE